MDRITTVDPAPARASRAALAAGMLALGAALGAMLIAAVHDAGRANPPARADGRTLEPSCRRAYQLVRDGEIWRPKLRTVCLADFAPKPQR